MNIILVAEDLHETQGGIAYALPRQALHLRRLGHNVHIIHSRVISRLCAKNTSVEARALNLLKQLKEILDPLFRLRTLQCDIIEIHGLWAPSLPIIYAYARLKNIPLVITPHGMLDDWALRQSRWKKLVAWLVYQRRILKSAEAIRAVSESEAAAVRRLGIRTPIAVIPNGVDFPDCEGERDYTHWKTLLYLGRLHKKKGVQELLEAWRNSKVWEKNWRLKICGTGEPEYVSRIKRQIEHMRPYVEYVGFVAGEQKKKILRSSHAFILCSYSEGLPVAALEAMSYGLPCILTPQCNLPQAFAVNAAIETAPSVSAIRNALSRLAKLTPEELQAMGEAGRALVESEYTWFVVARKLKGLYDWVRGKSASHTLF